MRRIIVTGSEGLIGSHVSQFLRTQSTTQVIPCDLKLGHDLTDEAFVKDWFAKNKAGYLINLFALNDHVDPERPSTHFQAISLESFNRFLTINLTSLLSVCREFVKNNQAGGIVNFSSTYGVVSPLPQLYPKGQEKHVGYCVSKAGVIQLTRYLATHLAPHFRLNCVVPGGVEFRQDSAFIERYAKHTPMGRMMQVNELNGVLNFLCSDASSYMTGSVLTVDGGWTAW